jgi:hypothetical protein
MIKRASRNVVSPPESFFSRWHGAAVGPALRWCVARLQLRARAALAVLLYCGALCYAPLLMAYGLWLTYGLWSMSSTRGRQVRLPWYRDPRMAALMALGGWAM